MTEAYKNTEKEIRCEECQILFMGHYARKFCSPECKKKADKKAKAKAKYNDTVKQRRKKKETQWIDYL